MKRKHFPAHEVSITLTPKKKEELGYLDIKLRVFYSKTFYLLMVRNVGCHEISLTEYQNLTFNLETKARKIKQYTLIQNHPNKRIKKSKISRGRK